MSRLSTETSQMASASKDVDAVSAQIAAMLSSLRAEVASAPTHFKGAAATAFTQLMDQYDLDATKLQRALAGISEQIAASGTTYASQDDAQRAALQASGSGLNMGH